MVRIQRLAVRQQMSLFGRKLGNAIGYMKARFNARSLLDSVKIHLDEGIDYIIGHWYESANFGDASSPVCMHLLSGKTPINVNSVIDFTRMPVYSVVGSVMHWIRNERTEVWGSGFLHGSAGFRARPKKVHAVRGPLSRELCLRQGVECPPIYGDPAVFVFRAFADVKRASDYVLGIIPHHLDAADPRISRLRSNDRVNVIDVLRPIEEVVAEVARCEAIVSSSLHGLILADSLSIPSRWMRLSRVVTRDGFKFQDYFMSIGRDEETPLDLTETTTVEQILGEVRDHDQGLDLDGLLEACPFKMDEITGLDRVPRLYLSQRGTE